MPRSIQQCLKIIKVLSMDVMLYWLAVVAMRIMRIKFMLYVEQIPYGKVQS